jgi:hypothetical protein
VFDLPVHLRLAIALAHALPGGTLELRTDDGRVLRASHGQDDRADLTPCELRAALLSRACPLWPTVAARLVDVGVTGAGLVDLGGGLYGRYCRHGAEQRWFATLLAPNTVRRILDECPLEMPEVIDAALRPDVELGVVVAVLSTDIPVMGALLDEAGRWVSASCYTQELLYGVQHAESS